MSSQEMGEISGGDTVRAGVLRESLQRLADGAGGPALREMARDVLDGRVRLAEAVAHEHYANALSRRLTEFTRWYDSLSPEEREQAVSAARCDTPFEEGLPNHPAGDSTTARHHLPM